MAICQNLSVKDLSIQYPSKFTPVKILHYTVPHSHNIGNIWFSTNVVEVNEADQHFHNQKRACLSGVIVDLHNTHICSSITSYIMVSNGTLHKLTRKVSTL